MAKQFCRQQFSGLELLSTPLLEEIIRADLEDKADYSEEMIQYVLEVIEKRKSEESLSEAPDVEQAWSRFQQLMEEAETEDCPLQAPTHQQQDIPVKKNRGIFRYIAVAAACIVIVFAMLITVQAAGVNILGALATWTDSNFRFTNVPEESTQRVFSSDSADSDLKKALAEMEIPTSFAPTWIPEGYSMTELKKSWMGTIDFVYASYTKPGYHKILTITIDKYANSDDITGMVFEKNAGDPYIYKKDGMEFYIFKNWDVWTAVCAEGNFCLSMSGMDSMETAILMINSIEEVTYE